MRDWMIEKRNALGLDIVTMSARCDCSSTLLQKVEEGDAVHPNIAARIAMAYGMDVDEYNRIVPNQHRADVLPEPK